MRRLDLTKLALMASAGLVAIVLGVSLSLLVFGPTDSQRQGVVGRALIGGPFSLEDHTGRAVTEAMLEGRPHFVYFGFTHCPDYCPAELLNLSDAQAMLADAGLDVGIVFITIDPERDDAAVLAEYISFFEGDITGLTGDAEQIAQAAAAYRVLYQRVDNQDVVDDYAMDHSTIVYVMDARGEFLTNFGPATSPDQIARDLQAALNG